MAKWEMTNLQKQILEYMKTSDCPVVYAKEVGSALDVTGPQASGSLRSLENHGFICGKKVGGGMDQTKVYYFKKEC